MTPPQPPIQAFLVSPAALTIVGIILTLAILGMIGTMFYFVWLDQRQQKQNP